MLTRLCVTRPSVTLRLKNFNKSCFSRLSCVHQSTTGLGLAGNAKKKKKREKHFYEQIIPWKNKEQLFDAIVQDIIYEDDYIVAVNKPNGIAMGGSAIDNLPDYVQPIGVPNYDMQSVTDQLSQHFKSQFFRVVFSQPRLYSGPVIFAKTEKAFEIIKNHFKTAQAYRKLCQKYLLVSVGAPDGDMQEAVEFPMEKFNCGEHTLMMQSSQLSKTSKRKGIVTTALFKHQVVDKCSLGKSPQSKAALVELHTNTARLGFIETYMVDSCLSPVLGDHMYSSRIVTIQDFSTRLLPKNCSPAVQKLTPELSEALLLEDTRSIPWVPLHIHCHEVTLPNLKLTKAKSRENMLTINSPVPEFFQSTLKCLGLKQYSCS